MDRVEDAIARVVGIENDIDETGGEVTLEGEPLKEAGATSETIEIEILGELLGLLIEDVERTVEIVDKESASTRLVAEKIHTRQFSSRAGVGVVRRDRHLDVVAQLERVLRFGVCHNRRGNRDVRV